MQVFCVKILSLLRGSFLIKKKLLSAQLEKIRALKIVNHEEFVFKNFFTQTN